MMQSRALLVVLALVASSTAACKPVGGDRYSRKQAQRSLQKLERPGIVIGEFAVTKVTDGDTVKVDGLDSSLRLLGIDAEETFKSEGDRRAAEAGFEQYMAAKRGSSKRPVKFASPMGEVAKHWGIDFFDGVGTVRVERDHPAEIRDRYDRYLAYVIANKGGTWLNYNVELVRAGMSPYFAKYGQSRRFHDDFVAAEAEAKAAKRGIWAAGVPAYDDYPERLAWWNARGAYVAKFRAAGEAQGRQDYIDLTHWDAKKQLEAHVGKEVHVLSTVGDIRIGERGPTRVLLSYRRYEDFPLIFFDRDVLGSSGISEWKGEYIVVRGTPTLYTNKHTKKTQLQFQVDSPSQIDLSPIPGLTAPTIPVEPAPTAAK